MKKSEMNLNSVIFGCEIKEINGNEYTLECVHCHTLYHFTFEQLRKRKTDICPCQHHWTNHIREDITNNKYGDLIVECLDTDEQRREEIKLKKGKYVTLWKCRCEKCGNVSYKQKSALDNIVKRNASGCCVCFGNDIIGKKFGRLTVLNNHKSKNGAILWECECDCGNPNHVWVSHSSLVRGNTTSCGCIRIEKLNKWKEEYYANYTPYSSYSDCVRLHQIYTGMKARCYNPNSGSYHRYGGRGITICNEWLDDFMNFKEWSLENGYEDNLTIDRIDSNGNYEPSNCRWVDAKVQANNTSKNKYLEYQGRTQTLAQWCEELGLPYDRTKARLNSCGMSVEEAFNNNYYKNDGSRKINTNSVYNNKK